jgi:acyl-CoA synthetase (AMP-forming)/AMP-acid ligase II
VARGRERKDSTARRLLEVDRPPKSVRKGPGSAGQIHQWLSRPTDRGENVRGLQHAEASVRARSTTSRYARPTVLAEAGIAVGETPIAAVVLRSPGAATAQELRDWVNARVSAKFQRVSDVWIVDDFPRNVAGKTLKRVLQEQYWRR